MRQSQGWHPPDPLGVLVANAGPAESTGPKMLPELSRWSTVSSPCLPFQPHLGSGLLLEQVTLGQDTLSGSSPPRELTAGGVAPPHIQQLGQQVPPSQKGDWDLPSFSFSEFLLPFCGFKAFVLVSSVGNVYPLLSPFDLILSVSLYDQCQLLTPPEAPVHTSRQSQVLFHVLSQCTWLMCTVMSRD